MIPITERPRVGAVVTVEHFAGVVAGAGEIHQRVETVFVFEFAKQAAGVSVVCKRNRLLCAGSDRVAKCQVGAAACFANSQTNTVSTRW